MKSRIEITEVVEENGEKILLKIQKLNRKGYELTIKTRNSLMADVFLGNDLEYIGKFENPLIHKSNNCYEIYNKNENLIGFHCDEYVCKTRSKKAPCNPNKNYEKAIDMLIELYEKNKK